MMYVLQSISAIHLTTTTLQSELKYSKKVEKREFI